MNLFYQEQHDRNKKKLFQDYYNIGTRVKRSKSVRTLCWKEYIKPVENANIGRGYF
jgi:hypothetical protein